MTTSSPSRRGSHSATAASAAPSFDVHGYSGCPLRVFHAPSWREVVVAAAAVPASSTSGAASPAAVLAAAPSKEKEFVHCRYFVEKTSESVAYNPRLRKQAEKQLAFFDRVSAGEHERPSPSTSPLLSPTAAPPAAAGGPKPRAALALNTTRIVIPPLLFAERAGVAARVEAARHDGETTTGANKAAAAETVETNAPAVASIVMPFVHHTDSLRFLCSADMPRINAFCEKLCLFMQWMVAESPPAPMPTALFASKLAELRAKCSGQNALLTSLAVNVNSGDADASTIGAEAVKLIDELSVFFASEAVAALRIPLGMCHGDLTLSNILVQESTHDRIVLIDFLDSFVESPLADMAKLNQDLSHAWTIRMLAANSKNRDAPVDPVRLSVLFHKMLQRVVIEPFGGCDWFRLLFRPMCIVSQMRVMQYAKDERVARYLWGTIVEEAALWKAGRVV